MSKPVIAIPGLLMVLALAAAPPPARADGDYHVNVVGPGTATGEISGFPGRGNTEGPTERKPGDGALLYGIRGAEKNNHPCYFEFLWLRRNHQRSTEHNEFITTKWHREPCSDKQADDKDMKTIRLKDPTNWGISSISVCNNEKKNKRLKGINIGARKLPVRQVYSDSDEPLSRYDCGDCPGDYKIIRNGKCECYWPILGKFKRPNCVPYPDVFSSYALSECPDSQVAVGINIHHDKEGATGLELICDKVENDYGKGLFMADAKQGPSQRSRLAGKAGSKLPVLIGSNVELPNDRIRYGITSVALLLEEGRPCRVILRGGLLDSDRGPDDRKLGEAQIDGCRTREGPQTLKVDLSGQPDQFLAGIGVCNALPTDNDLIRGLRLGAADIEADGTREQGKIETESNANCGAFSATQYCPEWKQSENTSGMIASGLVMHHNGKSFTGVELLCRDVVVRTLKAMPAQDSVGY